MAPMNIHAEQLYGDLGRLANGGLVEVGEPLAEIYNRILEEARKSWPNDPIVTTLGPVGAGINPLVLQG